MPANLPPQYFEAESRYRSAKTISQKINALEEMLTIMPKHKGTDRLHGELRRKLAKFRNELKQKKKKAAKRASSYSIDREGAGQVVLVGPPNVGKSQIINIATNASPEVAEYPFTTRRPTPGMLNFENIQIQLVDTPPLSPDFMEPWLLDIIRRGDLIMLVVDLSEDPLTQAEETITLLQNFKIRLTPNESIFREGITYKKAIMVGNKQDLPKSREHFQILKELLGEQLPMVAISAKDGHNLDELKIRLYQGLNILRVYTKAPGKNPDLNTPFILEKGSTVQDLAGYIHKDFLQKLKYARVWSPRGLKGLMVQRDYALQEGDIVELHT